MKNKIEDLRNHLFAQLERLSIDDKQPSAEEIARAREVSNVAKVLIDSARVEVEYMRVRSESPRLNQAKSDFIEGGSKALSTMNGSAKTQ